MKKNIVSVGLVLLTILAAKAQSGSEEIEYYQSIFGLEKKAAVASFIKIDGEQGEAFWELYDAYEAERMLNAQKRFRILKTYVEEYSNLSDEVTNKLISDNIKVNNTANKLIEKYYKKMKKTTSSQAAAQFFQLENYFQSAIRVTLTEQIPIIGEFEK